MFSKVVSNFISGVICVMVVIVLSWCFSVGILIIVVFWMVKCIFFVFFLVLFKVVFIMVVMGLGVFLYSVIVLMRWCCFNVFLMLLRNGFE